MEFAGAASPALAVTGFALFKNRDGHLFPEFLTNLCHHLILPLTQPICALLSRGSEKALPRGLWCGRGRARRGLTLRGTWGQSVPGRGNGARRGWGGGGQETGASVEAKAGPKRWSWRWPRFWDAPPTAFWAGPVGPAVTAGPRSGDLRPPDRTPVSWPLPLWPGTEGLSSLRTPAALARLSKLKRA